MIYEYYITVPAATAAKSPVVTRCRLTKGIVHKLEVLGDGGEHGMVHLSIRQGGHQVWPTNPSGVIRPGFFPLSYPVWYPIEAAPYHLVAYAWAPDTSNIHYITLRLGIQRREILEPGREAFGILGRLGELVFGRR